MLPRKADFPRMFISANRTTKVTGMEHTIATSRIEVAQGSVRHTQRTIMASLIDKITNMM
jgi:hypothetical protein